jgi:hypothetical protein
LSVSADDVQALVNRQGAAVWRIPIPSDPSLLWERCFLQAMALDPGANALGATTSNALSLTIGY